MSVWEVLPGVYEIETDLPQQLWQACYEELAHCQDRTADHYHTMPDLGTESVNVEGPASTQILTYFESSDWTQQLADLCSSNADWCTHWSRPSIEWFGRYTQCHYLWHRAPINYIGHEWHVDCLRTIVHGMLYLCPDNDPLATTLFKNGDNEYAVTTGWNRGWIILQTGHQTHRGINRSTVPRYALKFGISLVLD